jgi:hypothetical protein
MEIKIRLAGNICDWENIPVTMRTRDLDPDEQSALLVKLKKFCQSEFIVAIRWNDNDSPMGHYFENQKFYKKRGTFFRWIDEGTYQAN